MHGIYYTVSLCETPIFSFFFIIYSLKYRRDRRPRLSVNPTQ